MHALVLALALAANSPGFEMEYYDKCYPDEAGDTCQSRKERWHRAMDQYRAELKEERDRELEYLKKDTLKVAPLEGREKVGPIAPKWCKAGKDEGADLSGLRAIARNINNYLEQRFFSFGSLLFAAKAACLAPENEDVKRLMGAAVQAMVNTVGYSAEDAVADLTARLDEDAIKKAKADLCGELKVSDEADGDVKAFGHARALLFGCDDVDKTDAMLWTNSSGVDSDPVIYFLDSGLGSESELMRGAWLLSATRDAEGISEHLWRAVFYPMVQIDLAAWDANKFKQETSGAPFANNAWAKVVVGETQGRLKAQMADYRKAIDKLLKDDGYKEVLVAAPQKAAKEWAERAQKFSAALEHSRDFEKKAFGPSRKAAKGCAPQLRQDFIGYLKTVKASPKEFSQVVVGDPVGSVLLLRLAACEAAEGHGAWAGLLKSSWEEGRVMRGPRFAALYASIEALGELKKDRPKFPLDPSSIHPPFNNDLLKRFDDGITSMPVKSYGPEMTGSVVKSAQKIGDQVKVVFITEKFTVPAHICVDTNRIMRIDPNGTILYYRNCTFGKQMETIVKHLEDATFPADAAVGIKPGSYVEVSRGGNSAMPLAVYADKGQTKLVAWRGFGL